MNSEVPKTLEHVANIKLMKEVNSFFFLNRSSGAHHIDLRSSTKNDPDWLVEQRETEIKLIEGWISDYHQKNKAMFDM